MAGNATIGALRVTLGAETAAFDKGLRDAEKSLARFHSNITKVGTVIGTGLGAAVVGFGISIKKAIDEADKLGKLSQSVGIPIEQLSALKLAADLSGVSIEELGKGVGKLSKAMSEVAGGKTTGGAAAAFKALGISVKEADGTLKSSNSVLEEVAEKFSKMEDGAGKTALAISLFGKAGANLIPLLNAGAKGLRENREEAEALGLVIDQRTAKAAEAFNDNLTRLNRVMQGVALKIIADLAPALAVLTEEMVKFSKDGNAVKTISEGIIGFFDGIYSASQQVIVTFRNIGAEALALAKVLGNALVFNVVGTVRAFEEFKTVTQETDRQFAAIRENSQGLRDRIAEVGAAFDTGGDKVKKFEAPVLAAKNALDEFIKTQQKSLAAHQADAAAIGLSAGARESLRVILQAEAVARENNIAITARQREQISFLAGEMRFAAMQQQGFNLLLESATPHEKFRLEMTQNAAALAAVGATAEQVARVNIMTAEKFGATWQQVTAGAAGGFAALANEMAKSNAKIATVAKALAIVEATINTYVAFTKALAAFPPPLNYVAAAGVLAAGLAKVIAIKSQTIPKMASGGTLIPKAFPGQDSVLMQARVRPDEQVEVRRPGEGRSDLTGGSQSITLHFADTFSREFWSRGIEQINGLTADGYRLKVA